MILYQRETQDRMEKIMSARLKMIISMAIFGTLGLFVKNISLASGELALYRALLATLLLMVYLFFTKQRIPFHKIRKELPILFASGVAMGINWILLFQAYKYTTVSVATLSYYFAPIIVTIVCPILFHEKLTKKQMLCFVMSTMGLFLIIGTGSIGGGSNNLLGILFGLGAAGFYAMVIILNKFIKNVTGIHRTLLQFFAAIIILIPYVLFTGGFHIGSLDSIGIVCLLIVGFLHTGITYCMYFTSLKDISGQKAAILSYIDPLVAIVVSVAILRESMSLMQFIGGVLILVFTFWNEK